MGSQPSVDIPLRPAAVLALSAFLCPVLMGCGALAQSQASGQASGAGVTDASKLRAGTTTRPTKKQAGTWHHFGESNAASTGRTATASAWHHFGEESLPAPRVMPLPPRGAVSASKPVPPRPSAARNRSSESGAGGGAALMFELINRERMDPANAAEARGARPLRWNEKLTEVALAHSRDMIHRDYFDHVDPDGRSIADRLRAAGIDWQACGENIAMGPTVAEAEAALMNEPRYQHNHRWNILNSKYTDVGVGVARGADGQYYITQDFITSALGR